MRIVRENGEFNMCEILHAQLMDNIRAIKHDKRKVFRFGSLIIYMYFHIVGKVSDLYLDRILPIMPQISFKETSKSTLKDFMDLEIKTFKIRMQRRYRIPESIVKKYKDIIYFMVEMDITCMEVVEPRTKQIHPLGYEVEEHILESYAQVLLSAPKDPNEPRWGTYEEKTREVDSVLCSAAIKRKESKITSNILKIHGVTQEDLDKAREAKIAMQLESTPSFEMKSEKTDDPKEKKKKIEENTLVPTPIDLESTPPPEPRKMPKSKKQTGTSHASSRTKRRKGRNTQAHLEVGFRPNLEVLRSRVVAEGRIDQIGNFYDKYHEIDKSKIHSMIFKHMIKFKKTIL